MKQCSYLPVIVIATERLYLLNWKKPGKEYLPLNLLTLSSELILTALCYGAPEPLQYPLTKEPQGAWHPRFISLLHWTNGLKSYLRCSWDLSLHFIITGCMSIEEFNSPLKWVLQTSEILPQTQILWNPKVNIHCFFNTLLSYPCNF